MRRMERTFEELLDAAAAAPVDGWDFEWLSGRATEQRPSWGYQRSMSARLATATAALDLETGGGEVLAEADTFPPTMAATESWPPNAAAATARLHPRGAVVVATADDAPLPFADAAFDLVTSRHPAVVRWAEIARVLRPGGTTTTKPPWRAPRGCGSSTCATNGCGWNSSISERSYTSCAR